MKRFGICFLILGAILLFITPVTAQQGSVDTVTAPAPPSGWLERDTLTGDWGGVRPWLQERGITLKPRLTQFYQGMFSGDGDHSFEYGGKADLLFDAQVSAKFPHPRNTHSIDAAQSARDRRGIRQWVES